MMIRILLLTAITLLSSCLETSKFNPVDYINPQIGSVHGRWFFYTPAARPFGMAKLVPHTNAYGSIGSWLPCGYDDRHESIEGFGHFHEFQVGGLVFMPFTGEINTFTGTLGNPDSGYRSHYSKDTEISMPRYYSVELDDYGIKAEVTSTDRVGFHRYTYPKSDESGIIIDIGHKQGESSDVTEAYIKKVSGDELEGYIITYPEYVKFCDPGNRVKMYFYIKFNREPDSWGTFTDDSIFPGSTMTKGVSNGMYLGFKTFENEEIHIKTGL